MDTLGLPTKKHVGNVKKPWVTHGKVLLEFRFKNHPDFENLKC